MAVHEARTIANEFIRRGVSAGRPLTPMQLIKLVYLAHGWMLALFNRPLIKEPIEAWRYGPVIRNLYAELRYFGNQPVTEELLPAFDDDSLDREEAHIVNEVFQKYGRASGIALSNWTHLAQSPWDQTWRSQGQNAVIPNELMASYFRRLADDARSAAAARAAQ